MDKKKIVLTGTFSMSRDKYQWVLHQLLPRGKHPISGELGTKDNYNDTYHSTPEQILNVVINRTLGKCESLEEMRTLLSESREMVSKACEGINKAIL